MLLVRCLTQQHQFAEAERLLLEAFPVLEKEWGLGHDRVKTAVQRAAELYDAWGKPEKAAAWRAKVPPDTK